MQSGTYLPGGAKMEALPGKSDIIVFLTSVREALAVAIKLIDVLVQLLAA